jgi:hypothetical protein
MLGLRTEHLVIVAIVAVAAVAFLLGITEPMPE